VSLTEAMQLRPFDRLLFLAEADRVDAKNKYGELQLLSAIAPRDDKGKGLKEYAAWLQNRIHRHDKKKMADSIHKMLSPKRSGEEITNEQMDALLAEKPKEEYTVNEYRI